MNNAMILRNHGLLTVGPSVASAFAAMYTLERACQAQIAAQSGGAELVRVPQEVLDGVQRNVQIVRRGMGDSLVWPALLRRLERRNPGWDA
jgi:ribulose-5-phosphate 4-epimerase/fuculose-1-phosphate aldolase